jgi:hypothetical protein
MVVLWLRCSCAEADVVVKRGRQEPHKGFNVRSDAPTSERIVWYEEHMHMAWLYGFLYPAAERGDDCVECVNILFTGEAI